MTQAPERCRRCRTLLRAGARFCTHCGARTDASSEAIPPMRVLAAVGTAIGAAASGLCGACFVFFGYNVVGTPGGLASGLVLLLIGTGFFIATVNLFRPS